MQRFDVFLAQKPLYYKEIDHKRVHLAYALLKPHIKAPTTVHIVGTNGKGSTGRMLAHLASQAGKRVGHFSSPHILKFNERLWIDGEDASDAVLESGHQRLFTLLGEEVSAGLSYFEYTTLLAFLVFESCDLMVLEAGLGGEYDATNVCDKALSIITPIGIDHQAFLGEGIEEIAGTKIRSIQKALVLAPQDSLEVLKIAREIADTKGARLYEGFDYDSKRQQKLAQIGDAQGWGGYLVENAMVALKALDILEIGYRLEDLASLELFGRFYPFRANIRIDVGHNPLAAQALVKALDEKVVLLYNSLDDKDYTEVLRILKPKVKRVEIVPIETQRATTIDEIERALETVGLPYSPYANEIKEEESYLVFGSFYVVEIFLKRFDVPE